MKLTDKFKEPAVKLLLRGKTENQNSAAVVLGLAGKAGFFSKSSDAFDISSNT